MTQRIVPMIAYADGAAAIDFLTEAFGFVEDESQRYTAEDGKVRLIQPGGIALAFDKGPIFDRALKVQDIPMEPGDRLVLANTGAVEIRSPGDRSFDKIETYLAWGAREVWITDRDSRAPEVYYLDADGEIERRPFDDQGRVRSAFGIVMRSQAGRLEIGLEGVDGSNATLP